MQADALQRLPFRRRFGAGFRRAASIARTAHGRIAAGESSASAGTDQ